MARPTLRFYLRQLALLATLTLTLGTTSLLANGQSVAETERPERALLLEQHLEQMEAAVLGRFELLAAQRRAGEPTSDFRESAASLKRQLDQLRGQAVRWQVEDDSAIARLLHDLRLRAKYLEASATFSDEILERLIRPGTARRATDHSGLPGQPTFDLGATLGKGSAPVNDLCTDAAPLGSGPVFGDTSNAFSEGAPFCSNQESPDVWYRYSQSVSGTVYFRLAADFPSRVAVATGCPGIGFEVACGFLDQAGGEVVGSFVADPGVDYRLQVAGRDSAETGPFEFQVGLGGAVEGRVVDASNSQPLPSIEVQLNDEIGNYFSEAITGLDGRYRFDNLPPGRYFTYTSETFDYVRELYRELPCAGFPCSITNGSPIEVQLDNITSGIDFTLEIGGAISGRLTRTVDGLPPNFAEVRVFAGDGEFLAFDRTDFEGRYRIGGLPTGNYFVSTQSFGDLRDELYDDQPCVAPCDPLTGMPVAVVQGAETAGIDFVLDSFGGLGGTVLDQNQAPAPFVAINVFGQDGVLLGSTGTDLDGKYEIVGLPPGNYAVQASDRFDPFLDQLFDGVDCFNECDLAAATPVMVEVNTIRPGVDFQLQRLGTVEGTVVARDTQARLSGIATAFDEEGFGYTSASFEDGQLRLEGLPPGTYRIMVESDGFQRQLWNDVACVSFCDALTGDPVELELGENVSGIDFQLVRLGQISGRVTDSVSGEPVIADVFLHSADGGFESVVFTDSNGNYRSLGLEPGNYFVATVSYDGYLNELYEDIPCQFLDCELTEGTPVAVEPGETTDGIDFSLRRLGAISGEVLNAVTGAGVRNERVTLYNRNGNFINSTSVDISRYSFTDLMPGFYSVVAGGDVFEQVLYPETPCPQGICDLAAGAIVEVRLGQTTFGIDFSLSPLPAIEGTVARDGSNLTDVENVCVYDSTGSLTGCVGVGNLGAYRATVPTAGTYYAIAFDRFEDLVADVFGGSPCGPSACDPTRGTPIEVAAASTVTGIDFVLPQPSGFIATVRDRISGALVSGGTVSFYFPSGEFFFSTFAALDGTLQLPRIEQGSYFLTLDLQEPYEDLLYEDLPCPNGVCDPTTGTLVEIEPGEVEEVTFFATSTAPATCQPGAEALCLSGGRFEIKASWRRPDGQVGDGRVVPLSTDSGYLWFFDQDNVEMVVKVLDACAGRDRFWVFAAGLTNVEVTMTVTDTWTDTEKVYRNPLGRPFEPIQDTQAFATCDAAPPAIAPRNLETSPMPDWMPDVMLDEALVAKQLDSLLRQPDSVLQSALQPASAAAKGLCQPNVFRLCLADGRFQVEAFWDRPNGESGGGRAVSLTGDTGYFWFFDSANIEAVVKVLDACAGRDRFWVFAAGLTNVEVVLRVTDTLTGEFKEYTNPQGRAFEPVQDTQAFATCQ